MSRFSKGIALGFGMTIGFVAICAGAFRLGYTSTETAVRVEKTQEAR